MDTQQQKYNDAKAKLNAAHTNLCAYEEKMDDGSDSIEFMDTPEYDALFTIYSDAQNAKLSAKRELIEAAKAKALSFSKTEEERTNLTYLFENISNHPIQEDKLINLALEIDW